ncbi:MAG TPA: phosphoribosylglycinamide synthetase C domain-containing protein, partial [Pyrinomonadaceae bacterium]|nr:phosphoribosylglycinamide synthetase C domain-containing protein [Pyrinomonadaceae bacterium]
LEECLIGREVSLIMFADGEDFALMPATRDHKRIGEGDTGPNTGGMGTITDASLLSPEQTQQVIDEIINPTLRGCIDEGFPFRGILFLGLMMTADGPKLLEYNVRFGDPETQSILVRLETDIVDICEAMLDGRLGEIDVKWKPGNSATVVLAAEGYPYNPRKGDVISGLDAVSGVTVFHAGTTANDAGEFVTSGGRVLGVAAIGDDISDALSTCYRELSKISFEGMQYRRDIGC